MSRLVDADLLTLEHEIDIQRLSEAPTVKAVPIEKLEEMYTKYRKYLWRESDNVRGDDMIEIGYAEQFLQDLLAEFGCWDREDEE